MIYKINKLAKALKKARKQKGLSQQTLSQRVGLPQGHISNIENSRVDIKLSSFIELARALELEPMLIPRTLVNTIQALNKQHNNPDYAEEAPPAYRLDEDNDEEDDND